MFVVQEEGMQVDKKIYRNWYTGQPIRRTSGRSIFIWGCCRDARIFPVGFVSTSTNTETVYLHSVVLPSLSPQEEEQSGAVGVNDQTLPKTVEEEHDPYPHIPPKVWLPPVMNIVPGSICIPLKEKLPSKLKEGCWVLHQGMQTEK